MFKLIDKNILTYLRIKTWRIQRGGDGWQGPDPHGKSQVASGIFRNTGTDPPREAIGTLGPIASRGRSVRPSVKYVAD